ncbi:ATP-dependent DNA helicase PIF1 [Apostasia shenzhenica]|uniref:ATP-dependent DNA helicase n=1 Tax=Apostasia shenzhenica TaxID=1088818 RepID=A0A2I0BGN4_9ASPA|nr:ATP-dependent DNA helicase PIF1 [Apostasia shenzhenica]
MFAFTSLGTKVDYNATKGRGPYNFRIHRQNYHRIGSLIPSNGSEPKYAQLYVYDTEHEVNNRLKLWDDIQFFLQLLNDQKPSDRPDIINRAFNVKLKKLCEDLISKKIFGPIIAACWRLFEFDIHKRHPPVERLQYHLEDQQTVCFNENNTISRLIQSENTKKTMLTEWFKTNENNDMANQFTYTEFPMHFVWDKKTKQWNKRKRGFAIGRLPYAKPTSGERYYLRILLNIVKGATNFSELKTVENIHYHTFKDACHARGLQENNNEWHHALQEASYWASFSQLLHLFSTMLLYCEITDINKLWQTCLAVSNDDYICQIKKKNQSPIININMTEIQNQILIELENILKNNGRSLKEFVDMPVPNESIKSIFENQLIFQELNYKISSLYKDYDEMLPKLNKEQVIFEKVIKSSKQKIENLYFVYGSGGTGKTYIWKILITKLRSEKKIVLAVASSGIASLLLPGGRLPILNSKFQLTLTK